MSKKQLAITAAVILLVAIVLAVRGVGVWGYAWFASVVIIASLCWWKRDEITIFFRRKFTEWRNDAKQLGLWISIAFQKDRDAHSTATMTHQMQFLQGRLMSPMNLFAIAAVVIVIGMSGCGIQEWRIKRVKAERDAPCARHEILRNGNGNFRTGRASCASLGAEIESARGWRNRAIEAEAGRIRDVARIQMETELARNAELTRRVRQAASNDRQRRRQNEAITAALGGPSPDLERSLCELAGDGECAATGSSAATPGAADPTSLPAGTRGTGTDTSSQPTG